MILSPSTEQKENYLLKKKKTLSKIDQLDVYFLFELGCLPQPPSNNL